MHLLLLVEIKKLLLSAILLLLFLSLTANQAHAVITQASDTISTSRPSPSSPLNGAAAVSSTTITIFDNGSRFLASDSAKIRRGTSPAGTDTNQNLIVASQSADLTSVFLGNPTTVLGGSGSDVLYVPITSVHTIRFTIGTAIESNGDIEIVFPTLASGDSDNDASPSATTFQFNNLVTGTGGRDNVRVFDDTSNLGTSYTVTVTEPSAGSGGRISINNGTGADITAGSVITIMLGCSAASDQDTCTTEVPRIINPTKTAAEGVADSWKLNIATEDSSDTEYESVTIGIATIDSVVVRGTVDPTLSFSITGIDSGSNLVTGNAGCSITGTTNSGINSTSTAVNLGVIQNTPAAGNAVPNLAGQYISVSTNAFSGYSLTATASGSLLSPTNGFFFLTSETPDYFLADSDYFGIHPCGNDVDTTWIEDSSSGDSDCSIVSGNDGGTTDECYWAWPNDSNTLSGGSTLSLASDSGGPVGSGTGETGDGITSIIYGAGTDANVPPGEYLTIITYVATPTFE